MKIRSIDDDWEVTKPKDGDLVFKPSPYEPIILEQKRFAPFDNAQDYVKFVNHQAETTFQVQAFHEFDENHNMCGVYSNAYISGGKVYVTFVPQKVGNLWVSFAKNYGGRATFIEEIENE